MKGNKAGHGLHFTLFKVFNSEQIAFVYERKAHLYVVSLKTVSAIQASNLKFYFFV